MAIRLLRNVFGRVCADGHSYEIVPDMAVGDAPVSTAGETGDGGDSTCPLAAEEPSWEGHWASMKYL